MTFRRGQRQGAARDPGQHPGQKPEQPARLRVPPVSGDREQIGQTEQRNNQPAEWRASPTASAINGTARIPNPGRPVFATPVSDPASAASANQPALNSTSSTQPNYQTMARFGRRARRAAAAGVVEPDGDRSYSGAVGAAIGFWVALTVAVPVNAAPAKLASLRPINLNLPPPPPPAATPKALPPSWFTMPPLRQPSRPGWLPPWLLPDPSRPGGGYGSGYAHTGHGGHGLGGAHGYSSAHGRGSCHGGGHH
jgi:hypothetical protein